MITKRETKHVAMAEQIKAAEPAAAIDGAELYPATEGWRPVFDRFGRRYGFYHDQHGLKDDPAGGGIIAPAENPITVQVFASAEVAKANAAVELASSTVDEHLAAWNVALTKLDAFERMCGNLHAVEMSRGSSQYVFVTPDGRENTADDLRNERFRLATAVGRTFNEVEAAQRAWIAANTHRARVIRGLSDELTAKEAARNG